VLVERQRAKQGRALREDVAGIRVAWVLDANRGSAVEQQIGQQIKRLLCADRDEDLFVRRPNTAQRQYLVADLLNEPGIVACVSVFGPIERLGTGEHLLAARAPLGGGKQGLVELPVNEWKCVPLPVGNFGNVPLQGRLPLHPGRPVGRGGRGKSIRYYDLRPCCDHRRIGVVALPAPSDQITVIRQLLIHNHHGIAGDSELHGKCATRGQWSARRQAAAGDRCDQLRAQLGLERDGRGGLQTQQLSPEHLGTSPSSAHGFHSDPSAGGNAGRWPASPAPRNAPYHTMQDGARDRQRVEVSTGISPTVSLE